MKEQHNLEKLCKLLGEGEPVSVEVEEV